MLINCQYFIVHVTTLIPKKQTMVWWYVASIWKGKWNPKKYINIRLSYTNAKCNKCMPSESKEMLEYNANVRFIEFGLGSNAKSSIFFLEWLQTLSCTLIKCTFFTRKISFEVMFLFQTKLSFIYWIIRKDNKIAQNNNTHNLLLPLPQTITIINIVGLA